MVHKKEHKEETPKKKSNGNAIKKGAKLSDKDKEELKKHGEKHSKKHIDHMKRFLRAGKGCFADAHLSAMKSVGK